MNRTRTILIISLLAAFSATGCKYKYKKQEAARGDQKEWAMKSGAGDPEKASPGTKAAPASASEPSKGAAAAPAPGKEKEEPPTGVYARATGLKPETKDVPEVLPVSTMFEEEAAKKISCLNMEEEFKALFVDTREYLQEVTSE